MVYAKKMITEKYNNKVPTIIQDKNGIYWLVWASAEVWQFKLWISYSHDGSNWSSPTKLNLTQLSYEFRSSLIQDSNGTFWLSFETLEEIKLSSSSDCVVWNQPIGIGTKEITDSDPSLLQDSNNTYLIAFTSLANNSAMRGVSLTSSVDGKNWSSPRIVISFYDLWEPVIIQDLNKTYWLAFADHKGKINRIYVSKSFDTFNWGIPVLVREVPEPIRLTFIQDIYGRYIIMWGENTWIQYSFSFDGIKWSKPMNTTIRCRDLAPGISLTQDRNGTYWVAYDGSKARGESGDDIYVTSSKDLSNWSRSVDVTKNHTYIRYTEDNGIKILFPQINWFWVGIMATIASVCIILLFIVIKKMSRK